MEYFEAVILGVIQGLAEFLPVSSSGHLVIAQDYFGMNNAMENVTFDIFLHLATLLAVVWVYRKDLGQIHTGKLVGEGESAIPKWKLVGLIAISVLCTGVVLPFKDQLEGMFENISGVRIFLIINAIALAVLPMLRRGEKGLGKMTWLGAIIIGLAQAVGAFPGISRSGSTIIAGLLLGLNPKDACRYSFLLSIPTIFIAGAVHIPDAISSGYMINAGPLAVGFIFALGCGLLAIPLLIGVVEKGKLWGFAAYCAIVGIALFFVGTPVSG